jgi:hypothetical protein
MLSPIYACCELDADAFPLLVRVGGRLAMLSPQICVLRVICRRVSFIGACLRKTLNALSLKTRVERLGTRVLWVKIHTRPRKELHTSSLQFPVNAFIDIKFLGLACPLGCVIVMVTSRLPL